MPALSARPFHVMSADLAYLIALIESPQVLLAELLHLWEVVNLVDENLGPGEGGLRQPAFFAHRKSLATAYGPGEPPLVELPGIEPRTKIA